jgi:hypothetical protein
MYDAHPPLFSETLLKHQNDTMLDLARRQVKDESAHIDAMIDFILNDIPPRPPMPRKPRFTQGDPGPMYSIDKHSDLL